MCLRLSINVDAAASSAEVPTDPTAYYNDFWIYTAYYGEAAARAYYGAWSPPEGTPAPATMPTASAPASASAAAVSQPAADTATATATTVASGSEANSSSSSSSSNGHSDAETSAEKPATEGGAAAAAESSASADDLVLADPEVRYKYLIQILVLAFFLINPHLSQSVCM